MAASGRRVSEPVATNHNKRNIFATVWLNIGAPSLNGKRRRAVAHRIDVYFERLQHCQQTICLRSAFFAPDVEISLHGTASMADQREWHSLMGMHIRIAHRASIKDQRMIQQIAVAVGGLS